MVRTGQEVLTRHAERRTLRVKSRQSPGTDLLGLIALSEDSYLLGTNEQFTLYLIEIQRFLYISQLIIFSIGLKMGRYRKVEFTMMIYFDFYCSAISVELYYIFATLWGREQYTLYGILFIVYGILLSVTACIAVALTYFQLSSEDYRWWWRSIFSAGYVGFFST